MKKKVLLGVLSLTIVAVVSFSIIYITILSNNSRGSIVKSEFQDKVLGTWEAIDCVSLSGGEAFPPDGKEFTFTDDGKLKYFENGIEIIDISGTYIWKSNSQMLLLAGPNKIEQLLTISFDGEKMLVDDSLYNVRWILQPRK